MKPANLLLLLTGILSILMVVVVGNYTTIHNGWTFALMVFGSIGAVLSVLTALFSSYGD